jgi:predicted metal-dependent hydrolase
MPSFQYGTTTIDYTLEFYPNKKDITISVEWQNGVLVKAPEGLNEKQLDAILYKKAAWIIDKWKAINEIADPPAPKEFLSGEKIPYLGRMYRLKVYKDAVVKPQLQFHQGKFVATIPSNWTDEERISYFYQAFKRWYIDHGEKKLKERLAIYLPKMGVSPTKLQLKEQIMRWGTCTPEGAIYLNWRIMMAPMSVIDYLLVHELAHLKHPNHSASFWQLVQSILTDYEQRKEWLRINGPRLTL